MNERTHITAYLEKDEKDALRLIAAQRGLTLSKALRAVIVEALAKTAPKRKAA